MDLLTVVMIWKRMRGNALIHPFWLRSTWNLTAWITVLLVRSDEPFDIGWKAADAF